MRSLIALAVSSALLGSSAAAQDLEAQVVSNPDDTVTYTIDLAGPPGGGLWVSTFMLQSSLFTPYVIPNVFGEFYFNPLTVILGPTTVLDTSGQGSLSFTFPFHALNDTPIYSQALVVDSLGQLATSNLSLWYHRTAPGSALQKLDLSNDLFSLRGRAAGVPGTQLRVDHWSSLGDLKGTSTFGIGPGGVADIQLNVAPHIQYCDLTQVFTNQGFGWQLHSEIPWHNE